MSADLHGRHVQRVQSGDAPQALQNTVFPEDSFDAVSPILRSAKPIVIVATIDFTNVRFAPKLGLYT
jgi:hypothetical protein